MAQAPPPLVTWAQRPGLIFLTVCLEDCKAWCFHDVEAWETKCSWPRYCNKCPKCSMLRNQSSIFKPVNYSGYSKFFQPLGSI